MKVLLIDTETTSLNPETGRVVELGLAIYDSKYGLTEMTNYLINPNGYGNDFTEMEPGASAVNGITNEMVKDEGKMGPPLWKMVHSKMVDVQNVMAANYKFDKGFIEAEFTRHGFPLPKVVWADFLTDLPKPEHFKGRSVVHLAAEHGVLNPFPHRALTDCLTMAAVLERGSYKMEEIFKLAAIPKVKLQACVDFDERQKAKDKGFYWDNKGKIWWREVPENQVEDLKSSCDFPVVPAL